MCSVNDIRRTAGPTLAAAIIYKYVTADVKAARAPCDRVDERESMDPLHRQYGGCTTTAHVLAVVLMQR